MGQQDGADLDLSLEISGLRISVSGPPARVSEFVQFVSNFRPGRALSPLGASVGSFELVRSDSPARSPPGPLDLNLEARSLPHSGPVLTTCVLLVSSWLGRLSLWWFQD